MDDPPQALATDDDEARATEVAGIARGIVRNDTAGMAGCFAVPVLIHLHANAATPENARWLHVAGWLVVIATGLVYWRAMALRRQCDAAEILPLIESHQLRMQIARLAWIAALGASLWLRRV